MALSELISRLGSARFSTAGTPTEYSRSAMRQRGPEQPRRDPHAYGAAQVDRHIDDES